MNFYKLVLSIGLMACALTARADATEDTIKKNIEPRLGAGVKVTDVKKTPYAGLYEVQVEGDVLYTDANAKYLFIGRVVDTQTYHDYTKERVDAINQIAFADLPLNAAIKTVKGNGKRKIAIFEDPNCGYCKKLHKETLSTLDNVTIYTFPYNILSPDSAVKSRNIWCSSNPSKAWSDWMVSGKEAPEAPASCKDVNDQVLALGQKLRITGTPTLFFTDGSRIPGAIDPASLEKKLANTK